MNVSQEVGKAAQSTIDAMKSTPVILFLFVFNLLFIGMTGYLSVHNIDRWDNEVERWHQLAQSCLPQRP